MTAIQSTLFDPPETESPQPTPKPAAKRPEKAAAKSPARGEFEPVNPLDLAQESALWLTGQRSIAEQRGGYFQPARALKDGKWKKVLVPRGARYVPASIRHPGKMQPDVAGAILDTYTEPGWRVIDCMGGIGTTGVEGAERGRHVVCVELVRHWALVAYANALRTAYRGAPGTMQVIWGDARRLSELLAGLADAAVFSPPYGPTQTGRGMALTGINGDGRPPVERNIGARYDAAVFSPRYGPAESDGGDLSLRTTSEAVDEKGLGYRWKGFGNRTYVAANADAVIASPPYGPAEGNGGGRGLEAVPPKEGEWAAYEQGKGPSPGWQGYQSRAYVPANADAVITSPAYGDIRQDGGEHQFGEGSAMTNYTGEDRVIQRGRDKTNVGNKKYGTMERALALVDRLKAGETIPESEWADQCYLEDMALIDWHCLHVLKPGGLAIFVLKDYRRNKARVNLVGDTIRLMEAVGFVLHDRALALTSKIEGGQVITKVSPFVRLNAKKPEKTGGKVLLPAGEEVLVFRKG